ncbi:MAG: FprA family A-type flavoprotein [Sarcina sp.]
MNYTEIKNNLYWVGALDPELRVFDIIMHTPYGTSYNSYVLKGSEKTALFETVKAEFFDQYIERLKSLNVNLEEVAYLVISHTEPDHAGSIAKMLELCPNAKVVASPVAIKYLKGIANREFETIPAKDGMELSLGDKTLQFLSVPMLHWPDTIYTYIKEDKTLITCDSFGAHYSFPQVFDDLIENREEYLDALKYYFDCIMGPFKPFVLKAINKIKDLEVETICPGHGPVLRGHISEVISLYKEWSKPAPLNEIPKIVVPYVTAYGYTGMIAEEIVKGFKSAGTFDIKLYNVIEHNEADILAEIATCDALVVGTPTILGDMLEPIRVLLAKLNPIIHGGKVAGAFGSYGWSGEGVPRLQSRLKELKMYLPLEPMNINFKPSDDELKACFEYGESLGKTLLHEFSCKLK